MLYKMHKENVGESISQKKSIVPMTKQQHDKILVKWEQNNSGYASAHHMLVSAELSIRRDGAIVVKWCGMCMCIEKDGECHS